MRTWTNQFFDEMPKTELHLHLDGALDVTLAWKIYQQMSARQKAAFNDVNWQYDHLYNQLGTTAIRKNQAELLKSFDLPGRLLQSAQALTWTAEALVRREAREGIRYCEIRWAPALHTAEGLSVQEGIEAVIKGIRHAQVHCPVEVRLIACGMRHHSVDQNLDLIEAILPYRSEGLVAVDFAGVEQNHPDPLEQLPFFEAAHTAGLGITFHGGEQWESVEVLERALPLILPDRIAHGTVLIRSAQAQAFLAENHIALDVCPSSNLQASLYPDYAAIPIPELRAAGVPITLSTDDPVVSRISLAEEYQHLYETGRYTLSDLWQINLQGLKSAFCEEALKTDLTAAFEAWWQGHEALLPISLG